MTSLLIVQRKVQQRIRGDLDEVVAREPDLIIGSWCGKKFRPERVTARPGFQQIPAVQHLDMYEIKSSLILQPGPAALTDGLTELQRIIEGWVNREPQMPRLGTTRSDTPERARGRERASLRTRSTSQMRTPSTGATGVVIETERLRIRYEASGPASWS